MNCKKVQKYLQDYIEGELDEVTAQEVSQHLHSCARCTEELEYLKQYLSNMKGLETVRAPEDFLERVHRRIEESPERRKLFHTLFSPLRFKIPLELSAVAAMVIAVIFVLQVTRPVKRMEPVVVEKKAEIAEALPSEKAKYEKVKPGEAKPEKMLPEKTQQVKKTQPAEKTVSESVLQAKKMQPSEGTAASEGVLADKITVSSEKTPAPERKRESKVRSGEALREGGRPGVLRPATELSVVMVLTGEQENEEEALKASPAAAEVPSEYSKELKAASNAPLMKAADQLFGLVQSEGGTVVEKSFPNTPDQSFVVTADIPGSHINSFLEQLGTYGEIQIPTIGEAEKKAITVRIRIEIRLPAQ